MVRADLINQLSSQTELSKEKARKAVDTVLKSITGALANGDRVEIRGFGSFTVRTRNPRQGRNPKTGDMVHVPAKKFPFFKAGRDLKIVG
jgi:integration host factor subunit beta